MATSFDFRRRCIVHLRRCLLGSLAGAGFLFIQFGSVRAAVTFSPGSACNQTGDTITCAGDLSSGVDVDNSAPDIVSALIVSSLTPINVSSLSGIKFQSDGVIVITSKAVIISQDAASIEAISSGRPDGGDVTVTQTGNITTRGASVGIFANSNVLHSSTSPSDTAGDVTVTQTGNITALGARGIYAWSRAAAGIAGSVIVTQAGDISAGSEGISAVSDGNRNVAAGDVTVTQTGNIAAQGSGIWANSSADRDNGAAGDVTVTQTGVITANGHGIDASSAGGSNGKAGRVSVRQFGSILTNGDGAYGITAHSFMGGSGNAGAAGDVYVTQSGNLTTLGDSAPGIEAYSAASDGQAGNVTVVQTGKIETQGNDAYSIGAYSTSDHGNADNVTVSQTGNITTHGDGAYAIESYSKADDGTAGNVIVTQSGDITTTGTNAFGVSASTRDGLVGSDVTVTRSGNLTTLGDGAYGIFASSTGDTAGGDVTVWQTGIISTHGDGAYGIQAVSMASHGTVGDVAVTQIGDIITTGAGSPAIRAVSSGGVVGGDVTVTAEGSFTTQGDGAYGISASSSGDTAGGAVTVTQIGDIAAQAGGISAISSAVRHTGTAGDVTVTQTGNITTLLDGIRAMSGAGVSGTAGHVTVTQSGEITAGDQGIYARIYGQPGTGSIDINLSSSTIHAGGGANAGVRIEGVTNTSGTLNSYGATTISALSGIAVSSTDGDDTINNYGVLTTVGSVDLGAGANSINNMVGATYNSGVAINLGAGNLFTNEGTLSPGGSNAIATTSITGNFVQTSKGQLLTDISLAAGSSDLTTVTGTASLAGNVRVQSTDIALGRQQVTIFSATGGTTNNGLGVISSPALHTSLLFPNANDVALDANIDFLPEGMGLNHNQVDLANYLNMAAGVGSPRLNPVLLALVNGPVNMTEYRYALNQLMPAVYLNSEMTSLFSSAEFSNDLFSCNIAGTGTAFIRQDQCVWVRPKSQSLDFQGTSQYLGFDDRTTGVSAGAQYRLAPNWFANVAFGYERGHTETSTGAKSDGDYYQAGLSLKYQPGSWLFGGAVSGGVAQFDTARTIAFPGFAGSVAQSDPDISFVTAQLRAAYLSDFVSWYAKPLVDMHVTYLDRDAVTETGDGSANLWINGANDTYFSISPAVEFGTEYAMGGMAMKPFLKTGITYFADTHSSLTAGFVGAAPGVNGFTIDSNMDDLYADVEAGVQIFKQDGSSLSFGYKEMISDVTRQNSVFAKGTMKF